MRGYRSRDLNEECLFYAPCRIKSPEQTRRKRDDFCGGSNPLEKGKRKSRPVQHRQAIPYRDAKEEKKD